jgi:hypothetical protein
MIVALSRNELTFEELDSPDAILCFGCNKDHLLGNYIPIEASWVQGCQPQFGEAADINKLTTEALILWNRFRMTVERADSQYRTKFRIGNYLEYIKENKQAGHEVWRDFWRDENGFSLETNHELVS